MDNCFRTQILKGKMFFKNKYNGKRSDINSFDSFINEINKIIFFLEIVDDLFSYDEAVYKKVLDQYFTSDAILSHPLLTVSGTHNIRKVFRVWTTFNKQEPEILSKDDIIFEYVRLKNHFIFNLF